MKNVTQRRLIREVEEQFRRGEKKPRLTIGEKPVVTIEEIYERALEHEIEQENLPEAEQRPTLLDFLCFGDKEIAVSESFRHWKPTRSRRTENGERIYLPRELGAEWGYSADIIRELFKDEDGVRKINRPARKTKRVYCSIRIPQSVAERVHRRISGAV